MKVTFYCDNGANHKSCRTETLDTVDNLGLDEGDWEDMSEETKLSIVNDWAQDRLEIYFKEHP